MNTKQQTLKAPVTFSGKGLHTGVRVTMTVRPAEADRGIVFRRVDLEGQPEVPALCEYVTDTSRGTTIEHGAARPLSMMATMIIIFASARSAMKCSVQNLPR